MKSKFIIIIESIIIILLILFLLQKKSIEKTDCFAGIRKDILDTIETMKQYPFLKLTNPEILDKELINQQRRQIWLFHNASKYELYKLLDYPNGNVKAYSFYAIFYLHGDSSILKNRGIFEDDTLKVWESDFGFVRVTPIQELIDEIIKLPPLQQPWYYNHGSESPVNSSKN